MSFVPVHQSIGLVPVRGRVMIGIGAVAVGVAEEPLQRKAIHDTNLDSYKQAANQMLPISNPGLAP